MNKHEMQQQQRDEARRIEQETLEQVGATYGQIGPMEFDHFETQIQCEEVDASIFG